MLKKIFKFIFLTFIITTLLFVFIFSDVWKETAINTIELWLYKVVLSIIPVYILSSLLLTVDSFAMFAFKLLKRLNAFENYKAFLLFCLSFLTGNPTSIVLINNALSNNEISLKQANKLFSSCSHVSFLFVLMVFDLKTSIILILSQIISTFILYFYKCKFNVYNTVNSSHNILNSINIIIDDLPLMLLKILSSMLIITLIKIPFTFFNNNIIRLLLDYLEVSTGLVDFININTNDYFKFILYSSLLSLNGGAILLQVYNITKKTKLDYRRFIFTRIKHAILSSIFSLVLFILFFKFIS